MAHIFAVAVVLRTLRGLRPRGEVSIMRPTYEASPRQVGAI